jgi:hypothetical protein
MSQAEEEIADHLMTELARELMSQARIGLDKAPSAGSGRRR